MIQLMRKLVLHFHSDTARQKFLPKVILAKTFVLKNIRNIFVSYWYFKKLGTSHI